jgi:hypothetical protein
MSTKSGQESPSAKREDGEITVSRTIQIPSASIVITGTLTAADRTYRQITRFLLLNGYSLSHQTKTEFAPPGEVPPPPDDKQVEIDRLVDQGMEMVAEIAHLELLLRNADTQIESLNRSKAALEEVLANVTGK